MTPFERAADRYDANTRARKRARARRAQQTELKADIAFVLAEAEAVLASLSNHVVTTPSGATTVKDVTGHVQRLLRRMPATRSARPDSARQMTADQLTTEICRAAEDLLAAIDGVTTAFDVEAMALRSALRPTRAATGTGLPAARRKETS